MLITVFGALTLAAATMLKPLHWTPPSTNGMRDLSAFLQPYRTNLDLPALAVAVVHRKQVVGAAAVGERKVGSGTPVTLDDVFHIGSCTKSMTALLAVELVREGKIELTTRVDEIFPKWNLQGEKRKITLEELLQNRSGISGKPPGDLWARAFGLSGSAPEQRKEFLQRALAQELAATPGTKFIYSNLGFALAGAMLEERAGLAWEDLVQEKVFRPLKLGSAGFGPPSSKDAIDNPWGHQRVSGKVVAIPPTDNPVVIAPAGLVHLSILDIARYAAFHRDVFNDEVPELKGYRARMYSPPEGSDYAFGWMVQKRGWAGGAVLTHAGSNTMFYTVIWIAPLKGYAFVVATNIGDKDGAENVTAEKCDQIVAALIKEYVK
jgi:CubicO group peptidase (beta-lactamase class C family)